MNILITGTSSGIGKACALKFLNQNHKVWGLDIQKASIEHKNYVHIECDVSDAKSLPVLPAMEIIINNAGVQSATNEVCLKDISVNLIGSMNVTNRYAFNPAIKSVLFNSSASALTGNEFASYAASKAGLIGFMKNVAIRLANQFKATSNAICFGGVSTALNEPVMNDPKLWNKIMDVTPLKKWCSVDEAAEWCYFLTVTNTFCTGQAIEVSGGERNCADLFVWEN
ncbi:MAG: SDR family oxidoreductase [Treponema sp.]|nr:SDR family oxidoreductase [Treponema sp.]